MDFNSKLNKKMSKLYNKVLFSIFSLTLLLFSFVYAEDPDSFLVEVQPSSFWVNESVDITISAVKDWEVIQDYIWDVFIEVRWIMPDDYIVPSNGLYSFLIQDQWVKLFSKWLEIKKAWTYNIRVSDIIDENIMWETTVIVWNLNAAWDLKTINITSPINWSTENKSAINVIWSSFDLRNSPVEVYLNNMLAGSSNTDSMWNFNVYISDLNPGENQIQAKITDINDILLWESNVILVNYESPSDWVFNSIEILPSGSLKQWDQATFNVYVAEDVTSVEMSFSDGTSYPLDRLSPGVFKKDMTLVWEWSTDVSISLVHGWNLKDYDNVANFFVKESKSVGSIRFVSTWVDGTSVYVSWDAIWNSPRYRVSYGTDRNSLQKTVDVNSTQILIENLQIDTVYYFQITPLDDWLNTAGESSEIVEYNPKEIASSCVVKWILVKSEKIWDKYFLVWEEWENVDKYEIYRSDREDMSDTKKIWETTGTRFEYFFDKYSEVNQYAYYQVQAVCSDGTNVTIDEAQKVQVWPLENTLLIIVITLFWYSIYRLYRTID
jgi:hypothetical protein